LDSNRTSFTAYGLSSTGGCRASTASVSESYGYDAADRLLSSTVSGTATDYGCDTQGDVVSTPSVDAGGSGTLTANYLATGMLASQTQGSKTTSYTVDGTMTRYATATDSSTGYTTVNDYSDSADSPSTTNGTISVNVIGLDGILDATVNASSGAVSLLLSDLLGDVIASVNPSSDRPRPRHTPRRNSAPPKPDRLQLVSMDTSVPTSA
jgi:YD repeat-containing protein